MIEALRRREDILVVQRRGRRVALPTMRARSLETDTEICRIAYAIPRQFGSAPERNRAKRRLVHAAREVDHLTSVSGDHVVTPTRSVLTAPWAKVVEDVQKVLTSVEDV